MFLSCKPSVGGSKALIIKPCGGFGPGSAGERLQYKVVTFGVSVRESTIQAYKRKCRETLVTVTSTVVQQPNVVCAIVVL